MTPDALGDGVVYTETVVHTAPEKYVRDAPYQIGIIEIPGRGRVTARIIAKHESGEEKHGGRARIGDHVSFTEWREGVPYFSVAEKPPGADR